MTANSIADTSIDANTTLSSYDPILLDGEMGEDDDNDDDDDDDDDDTLQMNMNDHVEAVVDTGDNDVCIDGNFLALGDLMDIEELDKFDFQILRW